MGFRLRSFLDVIDSTTPNLVTEVEPSPFTGFLRLGWSEWHHGTMRYEPAFWTFFFENDDGKTLAFVVAFVI